MANNIKTPDKPKVIKGGGLKGEPLELPDALKVEQIEFRRRLIGLLKWLNIHLDIPSCRKCGQ